MLVKPDTQMAECPSCGEGFSFAKADHSHKRRYCSDECGQAQKFIKWLEKYFKRKGLDNVKIIT